MGHGAPLVLHHGSAISGRERGLIVGYEMDAQEGMLINKEVTGAGGGSDGLIVSAARQMRDAIHGNGLMFNRPNAHIQITNAGDTHTAGTIAVTIRPWELLGGNLYYIMYEVAVGTRYIIWFSSVNLYTRFGDAALQDTGYDGIVGKSFRLLVTWNSTHVWVYVDGNLIDEYDSIFVDDMDTFWISSSPNSSGGNMFDPVLLRRQFTPEDAKRDYMLYAPRAHYQESFRSAHVSSSTISSGLLENTQWTVTDTGTTEIAINHDLSSEQTFGIRNSKYISCVDDGNVWIPTERLGMRVQDPEAAYGTWEWWSYVHAAGKVWPTTFMPVSSTNNTGTTNGYAVSISITAQVEVYEVAGGGWSQIFTSAAGTMPLDTWVKFKLSRRFDGQFTIYMNGVLITPYGIATNPFTDNTHKTSSYVLSALFAGDRLGPVVHMWGTG